jgi:putative ABC transport system permease protein
MLRNYFTIAARTLWTHRGHTVINGVGLALGLAACMLLALYVQQEVSYDEFHEKADRIYQVVTTMSRSGSVDRLASTPVPSGPEMRASFPQVERLVRLDEQTGVAKVGDTSWETDVLFAGAGFFEMFSFPLRRGRAKTALDDPNSVVLTTEKARTYFGSTNVVGRRLSLQLNGTFYEFTVAGVARPAPNTSSIPLGVVVPFTRLTQIDRTFKDSSWRTLGPQVFVQLPSPDHADRLSARLPEFVRQHVPKESAANTSFGLLPLTEIHLTPDVYGQLVPPSRPLYAYILAGLAAFILLIAGINFVTLATGRSAGRSREIGVRKTLGAGRGQIMTQFWGEALLLCGGAVGLGLLLTWAALPVFSRLVNADLTASALLQPEMILVMIGLLGLVGLMAGAYPAVVLSRFEPVSVLRGQASGSGSPGLVQGLVVLQFVLSIGLITGTAAMWQQMDLLRSKNLGFEQEHLVTVDARQVRSQQGTLLKRLRQAAGRSASIQHVTATWGEVATEDALPNRLPTTSGEKQIKAHPLRAHYDVVDAFALTLTEGRSFSPEYGRDARGESVLVNEALVDAFGWKDPLGKTVSMRFGVRDAEVVGVVEDFHFQTLHRPIEPLVIHMPVRTAPNRLYARIAPGQTDAALDQLRAVWNETVPALPFSALFLDATIERQYRADRRWTRIITWGAGFAIFIACLGLFGLATLAARRRVKEIGIRKALGATAASVVRRLSLDFLKPVAVAALLAMPLAYWGVQQWLQTFAYRIDLGIASFLGAAVLALGIALLAVITQTLRAARIDPATTLRDE